MKRKYENFKYKKLTSIETRKAPLSLEDVSVLVAFAKSKNEPIRSWAAELLVNRYTEQSEEILYHMTYDRCDIVRINAEDSLCIGKQLESLLASEASAWVKVCIVTNLYLCGCEPGIDKIADILDKAVRDGDFKVVWCVLHTLDELVTGGNEAFIKAMNRKVYSSLIPAQQEYVREHFFPDNKR